MILKQNRIEQKTLMELESETLSPPSWKIPFCFSEYLPYTLPRHIEYCKETNFTQAVSMVEEVSNSITGANP